MNTVIMGCGRVGARLAYLFDRAGHTVTVVDRQPEAFARLPADYRGSTRLGTGIDEDVLRAAGIESADLFLAVTNSDNANIMAAQIAKLTFRVARVVVRIYDPDREDTFHQMGLETICPTTLIANRIYESVTQGADVHIAAITLPAVPLVPAAPSGLPASGLDLADDAAETRHNGHLTHTLRQRFFR